MMRIEGDGEAERQRFNCSKSAFASLPRGMPTTTRPLVNRSRTSTSGGQTPAGSTVNPSRTRCVTAAIAPRLIQTSVDAWFVASSQIESAPAASSAVTSAR